MLKPAPNQINLFDTPAPVIEKPLATGKELRDRGIERAIIHANEMEEGWSERAFILLKEYIKNNTEFLAEDFREWSKDRLIQPAHNRAFGGIFFRARKQNLIKRINCIPVKNPKAHRCLATLWRKV